MGWGIGNIGSGGSSGFNFEIKSYSSKSVLLKDIPKENTIGIVTNNDIHTWSFSATEPRKISKNRNIITYPYTDASKKSNGITFTVNNDGSIIANGTATDTAFFNVFGLSNSILFRAGNYILSGCPAGGSVDSYCLCDNYLSIVDSGDGAKMILDKDKYDSIKIRISKGTTVSNIVFRPQLEKGLYSTSFVKGDATGHLWVKTGSSGTIEFNALKKNGIQIYPLSAKQVIGTDWFDVTAMIYQGGEWKSWWSGELYDSGNEYEAITGGFEGAGLALMSNFPAVAIPTITRGTTSMKIENPNGGGVAITKNKIDLTNYNTIEFEGTMVASGTVSDVVHVGIWSELGNYCTDNRVAVLAGARNGTYTIPISNLSGEYYIGFYVWSGSSITVKRLRLL